MQTEWKPIENKLNPLYGMSYKDTIGAVINNRIMFEYIPEQSRCEGLFIDILSNVFEKIPKINVSRIPNPNTRYADASFDSEKNLYIRSLFEKLWEYWFSIPLQFRTPRVFLSSCGDDIKAALYESLYPQYRVDDEDSYYWQPQLPFSVRKNISQADYHKEASCFYEELYLLDTKYFSSQYTTEVMLEHLVKKEPENFWKIKKEAMTLKLFKTALKNNIRASHLSELPEVDQEVVDLIYEQDPATLARFTDCAKVRNFIRPEMIKTLYEAKNSLAADLTR